MKSHGSPPDGARLWSADVREHVIKNFHELYYDSAPQTWYQTRWMGVSVQKNPFDLFIYQEIIFETRPDIIIECGTLHGGSALYLAHIANLIKPCDVITVDIVDNTQRPEHERILYINGDSTDPRIIHAHHEFCSIRNYGNARVMVILDSDHSADHVYKEMELYGPLVTPGCYMIVEDTNLNGHPVWPEYGPGPMEAVDRFLPKHPEFEIDKTREKLMLTFNSNGYLRKRITND